MTDGAHVIRALAQKSMTTRKVEIEAWLDDDREPVDIYRRKWLAVWPPRVGDKIRVQRDMVVFVDRVEK